MDEDEKVLFADNISKELYKTIENPTPKKKTRHHRRKTAMMIMKKLLWMMIHH